MSVTTAVSTKIHPHEVDIPAVYARDVDEVKKLLWKASHVGPELYVEWKCPCCSETKVIYAPDNHNRVWIILVSSTRTDGRDVVALEAGAEVDELLEVFPCTSDRWLLAGWYEAGLRDTLLALFGS